MSKRINHVVAKRALLGLLPMVLISAAHAAPEIDPRCDPRTINSTNTTQSSCPWPGVITHLLDCPKDHPICVYPETPPVAELVCTQAAGSTWCEAWPQADHDEYSYYWSSSNAQLTPQSTDAHSPFGYVECARTQLAYVTVTVVTSRGASGSATQFLRCSPGTTGGDEPNAPLTP